VNVQPWTHESETNQIREMPKVRTRVPGLPARMTLAMERAGTNPHQIQHKIEVAYTTVNAWVKGVSEPDIGNLYRFSKACNASLVWLITGEDEVAGAADPAWEAGVRRYEGSGIFEPMSEGLRAALAQVDYRSFRLRPDFVSDVDDARKLLERQLAKGPVPHPQTGKTHDIRLTAQDAPVASKKDAKPKVTPISKPRRAVRARKR
jgi:transcriptional regulator with XRE-family HTH domain